MALDAADHADIMKLSLEERVAQRVKDVKTMTKRPYAPAADPLPCLLYTSPSPRDS